MDNKNTNMRDRERDFFEWSFSEYNRWNRGRRWYIAATVVGALLLLFSLVTANFLFALIILLIGFIVFARELSEPQPVLFRITDEGVYVDDKKYRYKDLKEFYVIYEPPYVKQLYINTKGLGFNLSIPLGDMNPVKVREKLLEYIDENLDIEDEDFGDTMEKALKL